MIEKTNLFAQPDTAQLHTDSELDLLALRKQGIEFITSVGHYKTESGECHYRYNPDKTFLDVSTAEGYNIALNYAIEKIGVKAVQGRIDFRFDSYDNTYHKLYKQNRLLLLLLAYKYDFKNLMNTDDPFELQEKSIRVQDVKGSNWHYQFEFYNKKLCNPESGIECRLELRVNGIALSDVPEDNKVTHYLTEVVEMCKSVAAVRDKTFTAFVQAQNKHLLRKWDEEVIQERRYKQPLSKFLAKYADCFYTSMQVTDFIKALGYKRYNDVSKDMRKMIKFQLFSKKELAEYVAEIERSATVFKDE